MCRSDRGGELLERNNVARQARARRESRPGVEAGGLISAADDLTAVGQSRRCVVVERERAALRAFAAAASDINNVFCPFGPRAECRDHPDWRATNRRA